LHCYKLAINLHSTKQKTIMKNTTITHKTAFRVVYLHELSGLTPFETLGDTIFESYDQAVSVSKWVCETVSCETTKLSVKYIVAVPIVGHTEVEHINYLP
jgi:hypothetical protein